MLDIDKTNSADQPKWFGSPIYRYKFVPMNGAWGKYQCVTTQLTYEQVKTEYLAMFPGQKHGIRVYCNGKQIEILNYSPNKGRKFIFDTHLHMEYRNVKEMAENLLQSIEWCQQAIKKMQRFKIVQK